MPWASHNSCRLPLAAKDVDGINTEVIRELLNSGQADANLALLQLVDSLSADSEILVHLRDGDLLARSDFSESLSNFLFRKFLHVVHWHLTVVSRSLSSGLFRMSAVISEITFVGVKPKKEHTPPPNMPGWRIMSRALKELVETSGLSVTQVAKSANMSRQHLYDIMSGKANPTMEQVEAAFRAAGTSLDIWLEDRMMYGRYKGFHDKVQTILNNKGRREIALRVIVEDDDTSSNS